MTDKEKIRKEVERLFTKNRERSSREGYAAVEQLREVLSFIDSLEEEPVSEDTHVKNSKKNQHAPESCKENGNSLTCDDLERKAVGVGLRFRDELICDGVSRETAEIYAAIAQQKFMDGAKWKEEQLMKNAIEGTIYFDFLGRDYTYGRLEHEPVSLEDRGLKEGDKVKLIIIKEEQQ